MSNILRAEMSKLASRYYSFRPNAAEAGVEAAKEAGEGEIERCERKKKSIALFTSCRRDRRSDLVRRRARELETEVEARPPGSRRKKGQDVNARENLSFLLSATRKKNKIAFRLPFFHRGRRMALRPTTILRRFFSMAFPAHENHNDRYY